MFRLYRWLMGWGLGEADLRVFLNEQDELFQEKLRQNGEGTARLWLGREMVRGALHALAAGIRRKAAPRRGGSSPRRGGPSPWGVVADFPSDVRFGLRGFRRRPFFTFLVLSTLALGIGAFTFTFSLVDGVLLREMPYREPGELVGIWETHPQLREDEVLGDAWDRGGLTWNEFLTLRESAVAFQKVAVFRNRKMILSGSGPPERLGVGEASPALFPMLGIRPQLGRGFRSGEEGPGAARLAVLSHSLWASRFGSDPDILGSSIRLDGEPFEVVGVLPEGFRLRSSLFGLLNSTMDTGMRALWVPVEFDGAGRGDASHTLEALGRLMPGATTTQARAEVDLLLRDGKAPEDLGFRLTPLKDEVVGRHRMSILFLFFVSGILLLIACTNVAALFMSEAARRRPEMATRVALGAGRPRITCQLLTESVLLGVLGSGLGIALAALGIRGFRALGPALPRLEELGMRPGVLAFSGLTGVGTGMLFGLAVASLFHWTSGPRTRVIGRGGTKGKDGPFQRAILSAELALTVLLLISGGLLVRSLLELDQVDPGFGAGSVATVRMYIPPSAPKDMESTLDLYGRILEEIETIPGVERAGGVDALPFPGEFSVASFRMEGRSQAEGGRLLLRNHAVLPGYVETMGIPLLAGRTFTEEDWRPDSPPVMLVSEETARLYWPGELPLGVRLRQGMTVYEIVGIVGDVREHHLSETPRPTVYKTTMDSPLAREGMTIVARTNGKPERVVNRMREAIGRVDPEIPLGQESTLEALVDTSTGAEKTRSALVLTLGILGTLLASVGVFGVTAHHVATRTREMGIRLALGAEAGRMVRGVLLDVMGPAGIGIGIGLIGAVALSRSMEAFLFGIGARDGATFAGVTILLLCLCAGASFLPALRITRLDPMRVLREE